MKAVIQRVKSASLSVDGRLISEIERGLVVYFGVECGDAAAEADYLAKKIAHMRIFEDENGKMNKSVIDEKGEILLISQFTLCGDTSCGNRPSFATAERPERAKPLYEYEAEKLGEYGVLVKTGVFGADMQIIQHNDGPVTIIMQRGGQL